MKTSKKLANSSSSVLSMLGAFRSQEKYCDVNIRIGNRYFKSHRLLLAAVSEYFDAMFGGSFRESNVNFDEPVFLPDIDASAFETILQFVYSGELIIDDSNVLALLQTSEFLNLRVGCVQEGCIEFLENMKDVPKKPISCAPKLFVWARGTTKKDTLIQLLSLHILQHLDQFSNDSKFLEITFDDWNVLLGHKEQSHVDESVLLNAIIRWEHFCGVQRRTHVEELLTKVDFGKISAESLQVSMKVLVLQYEYLIANKLSDDTATEQPDSKNDMEFHGANIGSDFDMSTNEMHVYVKNMDTMRVGVLSTCKSVKNWSVTCEFVSNAQTMRHVALSNTLYCLSQYGSSTKIENSFSVSSSVGALPNSFLITPPYLSSIFDISGMNNNIYLYTSNVDKAEPITQFSAEQISQGVYKYSCELDQWFPMPLLKQNFSDARITAHNNVLYLIGHTHSRSNHAQAYDCRTSTWYNLPPARHRFNDYACCVHRGRIYVTGWDSNNLLMELFDPVAGRWQPKDLKKDLLKHQSSYRTSFGLLLLSKGEELFVVSNDSENYRPNSVNIRKTLFSADHFTPIPGSPFKVASDEEGKKLRMSNAVVF